MRLSAQHSYTSEKLKEICNHIKSTNVTILPFGTIGKICKLRLNNRIRKNRNWITRKIAQNRINTWNLRQIATTDENYDETVRNMRLSTVNARLIKSKENLISDELTNRKKPDILIATETWLQDSEQDEVRVSSCKVGSSSFQMFTKNRSSQWEGGITLII